MGLFDMFKKKKKEVAEPVPDANGQIPVTPNGVQAINNNVLDPNSIPNVQNQVIDPNTGLVSANTGINQAPVDGLVIPAPTETQEVSIPNSFTDITNGVTSIPEQSNPELTPSIENTIPSEPVNDFGTGNTINPIPTEPTLPSGFADAVDNNSMNTTINNNEPTAVDNVTTEQEIQESTDIVPSVEDTAALIDNPIPAKSEEENMSVDLSQVVGDREENNNFQWETNPFQEESNNQEVNTYEEVPTNTEEENDEVGPEIDIEDVEEQPSIEGQEEEEEKEPVEEQSVDEQPVEEKPVEEQPAEEQSLEESNPFEEPTEEKNSFVKVDDSFYNEKEDLPSSLDEVLSEMEKEVKERYEQEDEDDDDENNDEVKTIEDEEDDEEEPVEESETETEEEEEEKAKPILVEEEESDIFSLPKIGNEVYPDIFKQPTVVYEEEDSSDEEEEEENTSPVLEDETPFSIFDLPPVKNEKEEPVEEPVIEEPVVEEIEEEPVEETEDTINMEDIFKKLDFKNEKIRFCDNCGAMIYGNSATVCPSCGEPL